MTYLHLFLIINIALCIGLALDHYRLAPVLKIIGLPLGSTISRVYSIVLTLWVLVNVTLLFTVK